MRNNCGIASAARALFSAKAIFDDGELLADAAAAGQPHQGLTPSGWARAWLQRLSPVELIFASSGSGLLYQRGDEKSFVGGLASTDQQQQALQICVEHGCPAITLTEMSAEPWSPYDHERGWTAVMP